MLRFRSIRTELVLAFTAIVALVIGVAVAINIAETHEIVEQTVRADLDGTVRQTADRVDMALYAKITELRNIARAPVITAAAETGRKKTEYMGLTGIDKEALERRFRRMKMLNVSPEAVAFLRDLVASNESLLAIYFTDVHGVNVAVSRPVTDLVQWDEVWWREAKQKGYHVGSFGLEESTHLYTFSVAVPIPHPKTGEPNGVIKAIFDFREIENSVSGIRVGRTGQIVTYSENLQAMTHPSKSLLFKSIRQDPAFANLVAAFEKDGDGSARLVLPFREEDKPAELIVSFARTRGYKEFRGLNWVVSAQVSEAELLAPVRETRTAILLVGIGAVLVCSLLAGYVSWRLAGHLRRMTKATQRLGEGDLAVRLEERSGNELGQLAASFNEMARSLKTSMDEIEVIVQFVADGVVILDTDGRISKVNQGACELLNIPVEQAMGSRLAELLRAGGMESEFETHFAEEADTARFEIAREESEDRNPLYVEANLTKIRDASGQTTQTVLSLRDATDERRENVLQRDFLSVVSHKMKTPLTVIQGWAELLATMRADGGGGDTEECIRGIREEADELAKVMDRMLSFADLCSEIDRLTRRPMDAENLVDIMEKVVAEAEAEKEVRLSTSVALAGESVAVNAELIELVLRNLADNAVKFNDKQIVELSLEVKEKYGNLHLRVGDNGHGIPSELHEAVFQGFYQAEKFFTGNVEGVGLGLPLVKRIVEAHGGLVWVESTLGEGSMFTLTLPLAGAADGDI